MLSFDIRALESKAAQVDDDLGADDPVWQEGDPRPAGPVQVTGRLSAAGTDRFYFSGHIEGVAQDTCPRCLTEVRAGVSADVQFIFAAADDEAAAEDPDVVVLAEHAHEIDLRPAIREEWVLAVPAFVLCRDDCKGLCPACGTDLNGETCTCATVTDSRWAALRQTRSGS